MTIKVLHLIDSGGLYGAEMMLLNLVEEQINSGLQPLILSVGVHGEEQKEIEKEAEKLSLPVKAYRMKAGFNLIGAFGILRFAKDQGFQILHSHGYKFNILLGAIPRFIRKIPIITTVHGYVHADYFSKMHIFQYLDRRSLKRLDFVIFVSEFTRRKVSAELKYYAIINNGISMIERASQPETENKLIRDVVSNSPFVIGAFGRLTIEKGFDDLIFAFKKLRQVVSDSKLIIWGDGYFRYELERIIRKNNLSDSVFLPGYTENVSDYLKTISIVVISSHTEGLPIILLEAMKYKVPVLATEVGAIPEVLNNGGCGYIVPPGNINVLADKLLYLFEHRAEAENMTKDAYSRLENNYSSVLMTKKYSKLYSQLV